MKDQRKRLVVVSNRLPIVVSQEDGNWKLTPGSGGLVTALAPIMKANCGLWIGWPGCGVEGPLVELFESYSQKEGYRLQPIPLSAEEVEKYYQGFSNEALWPLFHDLLGHCRFSQSDWETYEAVNRRFAEAIAQSCRDNDFIWIHDYQLIQVGQHLRRQGVHQSLAFFLHIPFPSQDLLRRLPWRSEILLGLLAYDQVGFQTLRDRRNFVNAATSMIADTEVVSRHRYYTVLRFGAREIKVGHFPISIDFDEFNDEAKKREVAEAAWYLHENLASRQLVLGVDRLDYTKGISERFLAFERALEKYPELQQKISLMQVVVPSRTLLPEYQNLKETLDQLAGRINARFSQSGWLPIHYVYRSLNRTQLLAHYRASEIALISPLRDGMNLVSKEYCASSVDGSGVLILSEFAGAADQLGKGALLVNPYDIESTADAIYQAFCMPAEERQRRMKVLRAQVRRNDVHRWVHWFVDMMESAKAISP